MSRHGKLVLYRCLQVNYGLQSRIYLVGCSGKYCVLTPSNTMLTNGRKLSVVTQSLSVAVELHRSLYGLSYCRDAIERLMVDVQARYSAIAISP